MNFIIYCWRQSLNSFFWISVIFDESFLTSKMNFAIKFLISSFIVFDSICVVTIRPQTLFLKASFFFLKASFFLWDSWLSFILFSFSFILFSILCFQESTFTCIYHRIQNVSILALIDLSHCITAKVSLANPPGDEVQSRFLAKLVTAICLYLHT